MDFHFFSLAVRWKFTFSLSKSHLPKLALKIFIHSLSCSRIEFNCPRSITPFLINKP
ncbi:hypothetical protein NEOC95_001337 [Neochlamydia sp. AcF95]|nr:hypothetical protein [Neochlamydia sp. AcF95]